jgi:hypothetical protein
MMMLIMIMMMTMMMMQDRGPKADDDLTIGTKEDHTAPDAATIQGLLTEAKGMLQQDPHRDR